MLRSLNSTTIILGKLNIRHNRIVAAALVGSAAALHERANFPIWLASTRELELDIHRTLTLGNDEHAFRRSKYLPGSTSFA
ncbi:hypothetical protein N7491_001575 [Penicillium cf. griseofulvum]|uniref:Uncharacterized protein n=1 Tax=Penicillium cf. griseofulvum TaxID=2972120 RepID=A0A9W9JD78_9EURO|nr:hypothetical protein N7472_006705 [Penicillium cf. griseofulvum]KAJ5445493.1 hypothetical protein N7491_001575 [Penicillium cf. griseofulvum]KAJ5447213.1 hypothetical protein N7445_002034 [Penicillium cf. griseofulvum]